MTTVHHRHRLTDGQHYDTMRALHYVHRSKNSKRFRKYGDDAYVYFLPIRTENLRLRP